MPYTQHDLPWAPGSETSHKAAIRAEAFSDTQGDRYYRWLLGRGLIGATDAEAEALIPMRRSSICARRAEHMKAGRIVKTDQRRNGCAVWMGVER